MTTHLRIISSITGVWGVELLPTGDWRATHEEFDGAEDAGDDRVVYGNTVDDLIERVIDYGEE